MRSRVVNRWRAALLCRSTCAIFDLVSFWSLPWTRLFARRRAFLALDAYNSPLSFEDRWCTLKIAETRRFGYCDEVVHLSRLRTHGQSTANLDRGTLMRDWFEVERQMARQATGVLKSLLQIRVRSDDVRRSSLQRLPWQLLRHGITLAHRFAVAG